eukprot:5464466-Pyramimonas_sp.AAC.1
MVQAVVARLDMLRGLLVVRSSILPDHAALTMGPAATARGQNQHCRCARSGAGQVMVPLGPRDCG